MFHMAIKAVFALVIAALFTLFVAKRPGATHIGKRRLIGIFVVGLIVSGVLLATDNYYAT